MKFADSICKVYATSMAMLLTTLVSIACFGTQPSLQMALGILVRLGGWAAGWGGWGAGRVLRQHKPYPCPPSCASPPPHTPAYPRWRL